MIPLNTNWTNRTLAATCLALGAAAPTMAATINDGGTTVINSTVNDFIEVDDGPGGQPTTVFFEVGANVTQADSLEDSVYVLGNSRVVINGGQFVESVSAFNDTSLTVNGGTIGNDIIGFGSANVTMTDGRNADDVEVYDTATLTVSGGIVGEDLEAFDGGSLTFSGGTVTNNLTVEDFGTGLVTGGSIGNDLEAVGRASVTMRGGSVAADIEASGAARIDIFGGTLGTRIRSGGNSVITLYGPEFQINGSPAAFGNVLPAFGPPFGTLSGTLSDGSTFNLNFVLVNEGPFFRPNLGDIVLVQQAVPEPATLALLGLGAALVAGRQRSW